MLNRIKVIKDLILAHLQNIADGMQLLLKRNDSLLEKMSRLSENNESLFRQFETALNSLQQHIQNTQEHQSQLIQLINSSKFGSSYFAKISPNQILSNQQVLQPEIALSTYLYAFLPDKIALDIGANIGEFSEQLLQAGYTVYAFEPFPPIFQQLNQRLHNCSKFHSFQVAVGATDTLMDLHLVTCETNSSNYDHPSVYSTLKPHALPEELSFTDKIQVQVQCLDSLHRSSLIPSQIGLVKIDTEGFDLEVIRGMGAFSYAVVITEFWSKQHIFWEADVQESGSLRELVKEMSGRNYHWYIVICRDSNQNIVSYHCNYAQTPDRCWGNVFFFRSYDVFMQAFKWCAAALPQTYIFC